MIKPAVPTTTFGKVCERKRQLWGMPKATLCRRADITVSYYNYIIKGQMKPSEKVKQSILTVLDIDGKITQEERRA